ncbi:MAG: hypothetical protein JWN42_2289 [Candidatus Angelobacter sp.]|nr:hypothetical protein [Candidatus Angelobacter sp.]
MESGKKMRAMAHGIVNGKQLTDKENQEYQQQQTASPSQSPARRGPQELEQQDQVNQYPNTREPRVSGIPEQRAEALAHKLAQTYE